MRRLIHAGLVLALAAAVHIDWHLARPALHHRGLSLGWEQHWIFAALTFGVVGWVIARLWPERPWRPATLIAIAALLIAQGIEPMFEVALYAHKLGYPAEPGRWAAFFLCVAAGLPVYALAVWLCRPARRTPRLDPNATLRAE